VDSTTEGALAVSGMQSVNRALDVLFLLAQAGEPKPASEIAQELGLSRPTVYRIFETLIQN
jgi:DNA-binding IclR family transcriptional regulator